MEELVKEWGVGVSVSHKDVNELVEALKMLMEDQVLYGQIVAGCQRQKNGIDSIGKIKEMAGRV